MGELRRLLYSLGCISVDFRVHLASLQQFHSCSTQGVDSSIKFSRTHQMAASTAPPSSLSSTCWVFPTRGKCAAWSSYWPSLPVLTVAIVAQNSGHRCSPICGLRAALSQTASRPRFVLSTFSVLFFPLFTLEPSTLNALIRSLHGSATDRPSRTICICNSASADSVAAFVFCFLCLVLGSICTL